MRSLSSFTLRKSNINLLFSMLTLIGCTSSIPNAPIDNSEELNELESELIIQAKKIEDIENQLLSFEKMKKMIDDQSSVLNIYDENNQQMREFTDGLNDKVDEAINSLEQAMLDKQLFSKINKLDKKMEILEDRTFYTDSLYFEIVNEIVMLENQISSLIISFKEMNELSSNKRKKVLPKITDEEYTAKYIESLSYYQNSEWNFALDGFNFLIQVDSNHDLADNCQYWVAEVYYSLKDYRRSIQEFEKVFNFPGTNKADDSQYKLGLCYMNIGQGISAKKEFNNLIEFYPESEFVIKAKNYLDQH